MSEQPEQQEGDEIQESPASDHGSLTSPDARDEVFDEPIEGNDEIPLPHLCGRFTYDRARQCFVSEITGLGEGVELRDGLAVRVSSNGRLMAPLVQHGLYYVRRLGADPQYFGLAATPGGDPLHIFTEGEGVHYIRAYLKFRTFTFGGFRKAGKRLNMKIILGSMKEMDEAPAEELIQEAMTIAWMQCSPPDEVSEVFRKLRADEYAVEDAVEAFEEKVVAFDKEVIMGILRQTLYVVTLAKKTWFSMLSRKAPGSKTPDDIPGNS